MKSRVRFETGPFHVGRSTGYPRTGVKAEVKQGTLKAFIVTVEHAKTASPEKIVASAREALSDVLLLTNLGTGGDPIAAAPRILGSDWEEGLRISFDPVDSQRIRFLKRMPPAALLTKLRNDNILRRQAEFLLEARAVWHLVPRISLAYQVLELEKYRRRGYKPPNWCRHLRNSVSHPHLSDPKARAYLTVKIGTATLNLIDAAHTRVLKKEGARLVQQAARVIDTHLEEKKFW